MAPDDMTLEQLLDAALRLDAPQRELLAQRLLASIDDADADPEIEAAWAAEIERRLRAIDEGKVELIDGEQVFSEMQDIVDGRA